MRVGGAKIRIGRQRNWTSSRNFIHSFSLPLVVVEIAVNTLMRYLDAVSRDEGQGDKVNNWANEEAEACKHLPKLGFIDWSK